MNSGTFVISSYVAGAAFVLLLGYYRRISFLLLWPYLLYGFGLTVPIFFPTAPEFRFAHAYYNDESLRSASIYSSEAILIVGLLDLLVFRKKNFRPLLSGSVDTSSLAAIIKSRAFLILFLINIAGFSFLYLAAWSVGEIGGEYVFRGIENLRFWGPLGFATESVCVLGLLYVFAQLVCRGTAKRNVLVEAGLAACLVARAIPGTRMPLVTVAAVSIICTLLIFRIRFRHIAVAVLATAVIYIVAAYVGFKRTGGEFSFDLDKLLFPLNGETFFTDLSLLVSTRNIDMRFFQPGFPVGLILYLLPSWSTDKNALIANFYDRDAYAHSAGFDSVSPVGATNWLADSIIAYGPYFVVAVIITALSVFLLFRGRWHPSHFLVFIAVITISHNLWRDSFFLAVKDMVEICGPQYCFLWLMIGKKAHQKIKRKERLVPAGRLLA